MNARARIFLVTLIFGLVETAYFGWNLTPQSPAELVCDGIVCLMACIGLAVGKR